MVATVVGSVLATLSLCFGMAGGWFYYQSRRPSSAEAPGVVDSEMPGVRAEIIEGRLGALEGALAALKISVEGLPTIWKDERERTKNQADRAVAAYKSTEEVLEALSGGGEDEDEDSDFSPQHGEQLGLMSPVFGDVAGAGARAEADSALRERARRHLAAMG